jgi:WD40 repeat protein
MPTSAHPTPHSAATAGEHGVTVTPLSQTAPAPAFVDDYEILGVLGRGGMGVVYKARDVHLNRLVALKMILAGGHAAEADLARFRAEAEVVARLQHPHIVQIHAVGVHDGLPYLCLEFVEDGNLDRKLDGTPRPPREAAQMVETLARAVQIAHEHGVVHRDLKPANVLVGKGGVLKITDFGLARKLDEAVQTRSGAVVGTPSYMAPEQAAGRSRGIGPAVDIYALGATLYELLTGRPPFKAATTLETLQQVVNDEPIPPHLWQPRTPRDLETICLKCLSKTPAQRYASAADLAEDLRRFQAGEPIQARPVGAWERAWRWARRRPTVASLLAALVLVAAGSIAGLTALWLHAEWRRQQADEARAEEQQAKVAAEKRRVAAVDAQKQEETAKQTAQANYEEARLNLYVSNTQLAHRAWQEGNINRMLELLDGSPMREGGDLRRGFEWGYLRRLSHSELVTVDNKQRANWVACSPDGRWIATAGEKPIRIWELATGRLVHSLSSKGANSLGVAFSPDSRYVASTDIDREIRLWEVETGKELPLPRPPIPDKEVKFASGDGTVIVHDVTYGIAFSPDSQLLAIGEGRYVEIFNRTTGKEVAGLRGQGGRIRSVAFRADGRRVAAIESPIGPPIGGVTVWDLPQQRRVFAVPARVFSLQQVVFSPDGKRLVWSELEQVKVADAETGAVVASLDAHTAAVRQVSFSPDGRRMASASDDGTIRVWDAAAWKEEFTLLGHTGAVHGAVFTADGRRVVSVSTDGTTRVWQIPAAPERSVFLARMPVSVLSPDGSRYAWIDAASKRISIRNATTSFETAQCNGHRGAPFHVAFSPDGKRLISAGAGEKPGEPGQVFLWDAADGCCLLELEHKSPVQYLAFVDEGRRLVTLDARRELGVWDAETGKRLSSCTIPGDSTPEVSADGRRLALVRNADILIVDAADGKQLSVIPRKVPPLGYPAPPFAIALSADGRRLAFTSGTLQIADTETGKVLLSLGGQDEKVTALAFSPDGRRLASARFDDRRPGQLQIWETRTGQELLTLKTLPGRPSQLAFSEQRLVLLVAGKAGTNICLWHAASPFAAEIAGRDALELVKVLFERQPLRSEVTAMVKKDPHLDEMLRNAALEAAEMTPEDAQRLNNESWQLVVAPGGAPESYRLGLRQAEEACRLTPNNGVYLNTLGVAQYRSGDFPAARDTLQRADRLNSVKHKNGIPADVAFLAMARQHLGETTQAQTELARLRKLMASPPWAENREAAGFLHEAEQVLKNR